MKIVLSAEDRFRNLQRENSLLRMQNLDLMELLAEQEYSICLMELGVSKDDL